MADTYKILLESSSEIKFEKLKNQKTFAVYGSKRKRDKLLVLAKNAGISVCDLKSGAFYLSPKKLQQELDKKSFSDFETIFLLKIINWQAQTSTGDREELTFEREQYGFFDLISDSEGNDVFFKKALEDAEKCEVILIHQYDFAKGLADKIPDVGECELIIVEASKLEDNFTNALKKRFTETDLRPFFGDKMTIFFGLLGIFYERFLPADSAEFRGDVVLNNKNCASIEWRRVMETAQNLPEHPKKDELISALTQTQNNVSWISSFYNELSFTSAPISISDNFQNRILPFQKITLQSPALSAGENFSFIKGIFRLGDEWQQIFSPVGITKNVEGLLRSLTSQGEGLAMTNPYGNLKIEVLKNFPAPNTNDYFQKSQKLFMEIIEREKGGLLFILSSKKAVEALYSILLPETEKLGVKLRAVGASGGMGKSLALFLENPTGSILLATNQILAHFEEIEDEIKVVVFQKIPFDLPFDPLVSSRSAQFRNGFKNYSLPRAIMRFREMLIDLSKNETTKSCYILDSRLLTQDYGRFFL